MGKKLTQEQIIKQFIDVHGDKYDYSKIEYKGIDSKVIILCKKHGVFKQTPYQHRKGHGCHKCGGSKKLTTKEAINDFQRIYGNEYDYSRTVYINAKTKVKIICPKHGEFEKMPNDLKNGHGCTKCGNESGGKKLIKPVNEVLKRFQKVHGDKYDYSQANITNSLTPIKIICPAHGVFYQTPKSHKKGCGCFECGRIKTIEGNTISQSEIINQFKIVHGDRYDYSLFEYKGIFEKGIIICPEHGQFLQSSTFHKRGSNCPKCAGKHKHSTAEAIEELKKVHGNKYDYSLIEYVNNTSRIRIICPIHEEFLQSYNAHQRGSGCPDCSETGFDPKKPAILYYIRVGYGIAYKIGITNYCVEERYRSCDLKHIKTIKTWYYDIGEEARRQEKLILSEFSKFKYKGEPILQTNGNTELFTHDVLGLDWV